MMTVRSIGSPKYSASEVIREIAMNSVRGLVAHQLRQKSVPVIIMADEDARTGILVDLVDECKLAGARQVSVAAERE